MVLSFLVGSVGIGGGRHMSSTNRFGKDLRGRRPTQVPAWPSSNRGALCGPEGRKTVRGMVYADRKELKYAIMVGSGRHGPGRAPPPKWRIVLGISKK